MIRATTGGVLRSYRSNLMNSFIGMNKAQNTVLTQRTFNSYAEDPASAAKAFRLRKSRMAVKTQYDICNDTYKKFDSAWSSLDSVDKLIDTQNSTETMNTLKTTTLEMLNDPEGDARTQLSKVLDQMSETIVQMMNQKYGDNFIFAGADGHNVPFEVREVDGHNKLFYRGVDVDAATPELMTGGDGKTVTTDGDLVLAGAPTITQGEYDDAIAGGADAADFVKVSMNDADGNPLPDCYVRKDSGATITQDEYDKQKLEADKLDALMKEKHFVDIGLGFQEDANGNLIESSGFNAALHGLTFLGHGVDADGDPKNIYSIVQRLREIADSVPDGESWSGSVYDEFNGLVSKLEAASSNFKTEYTNMDAGTTKLKTNLALLTDNFDNLQEQYHDLEDVDMADSITSLVWAQYCYNAALKVGNSILSESLMDYLN